MKRSILMAVLLSLLIVPVAVFAEPQEPGPEIIKFKMGDLVLPFKHRLHQKSLDNKCTPCHATRIGKIENWGKDTAHTLCITCHVSMHKGPIGCKECHNTLYSKK